MANSILFLKKKERRNSLVFLSSSVPKQQACHLLSASHKVPATNHWASSQESNWSLKSALALGLCVTMWVCFSVCAQVLLPVPPLLITESVSFNFSFSFLTLSLPLTALQALTTHASCLNSSSSPLCRCHRQFLYFEWKGRAAVVTPPTASHLIPPTSLSVVIVEGGFNQKNLCIVWNSLKYYSKCS